VLVDNRTSTMGGYARPVQGLYWNFGGLMQEVSLERTPAVALTEMRAEGTFAGHLTVRATGVNASDSAQTVRAQLTVDAPDGTGVVGPTEVTTTVPAGGGVGTPIELDVPDVQPWDLDHPRLYTVHLKAQDDATWHELVEHTGFRDVEAKGLDLLLNGKPVEDLQGFDRHADYPGLGRTQPDGLADREIKDLRDKGFQLFRPAHYPTTPAELDAADKYGLLVIEEVNNISSQPGSFLAEQGVQDFGKHTLKRMIDRDRSHPSLFAWSVGNANPTETDGGVDYVKNVIGYGRTLDPTRLYTQVSHRHTRDRAYPYQDFFATNYYAGWYSTMESLESHLDAVQAMAKMPILISEYGAEAVHQRPGTGRGTEWYQAMVVDEHNRLLNHRPHFIGKMYWTSSEFWCTPTWGSGQNPEPVPPFHTKGLETLFRDHKLGWRVMFSPVRITRATVLQAPLGQRTTLHEKVTVSDARGNGGSGTLHVDTPEGFTAPDVPFSVGPGESKTYDVPLTGTVTEANLHDQGFVHAVVDSDTEALPHPFTIRAEDDVPTPASDDFASGTLDDSWLVVRPDDSGWSLTDRPGSLRLSTLAGGETGTVNTGENLFVRTNTPQSDWTAEASVDAPDLSADFQQIGLDAYVDDDNYVKVDLGWIDGRRAIEMVVENDAKVVSRTSVPYDAASAHLRLVRRGDDVTAEYSADGTDWFEVGTGSVAGFARVALQAIGGGAAPPVVKTYVDEVDVRASGNLVARSVTVPDQPLLVGQPSHAVVTVANGSDHSVPVHVALSADDPWNAGDADASVPAFGSADVEVPLTAHGDPATEQVSATVTSTDGTVVTGAPVTDAISTLAASDTALALDAGTTTSAVFDGYSRLSNELWDPARGYGWVDRAPQSRDRGAPDALRRDIVTDRADGTLRLAVPAGTHAVDLLVGDHSFASDPMTVTVDGRTVVTVDPAVPSGDARWFRFDVDGGASGRTVDLQLHARDSGAYWRFAALLLEHGG
jgi:beta-glucuronidase